MNEAWHILKQPHEHHYITDADYCLCKREYVSGYGYQGGPTNKLVLNFKKTPDRKNNPSEWQCRIRAVETFAREAEILFPLDLNISVTAIPSSKHKNDPEYDNRFEDLFKKLSKARPNLNIEWPIEIKKTIQASHHGGGRDPEGFKRNYVWRGFKKNSYKALCIFDDMLTTGAHFRAVSDFLRENGYKGRITGIFWSRAMSPEQSTA